MQTLDLLIPLDNKSCVRWITKKVEDDRVDRELRWRREADRDPEAYYYWLERLLKLSDAFEKTRPKSPRGWYYDRRDMGQCKPKTFGGSVCQGPRADFDSRVELLAHLSHPGADGPFWTRPVRYRSPPGAGPWTGQIGK